MSSTDDVPNSAMKRTGERVDAFLEALLRDTDVTVHRNNTAWVITAESAEPTGIKALDTAFAEAADGTIRLLDRIALAESDDEPELGPHEYVRAVDGPLVEAILEAATSATPVGYWRVADGVSDVPDPDWLAESSVETVERTFQSYYSREAVCVCYEASIETVSEFEQTITIPVAVDVDTEEHLPLLADWFASVTAKLDNDPARVEELEENPVSADEIQEAVSIGQTQVESSVEPAIDSVRQRSMRAANVEFEEYADLQREQMDQLREERDRLDERLEEISEQLADATDRSERLDTLDKRSELQTEREEIVAELETLQAAENNGFPEQQQEIRDRHSVEVTITAVSTTVVEYEKGDLTIKLQDGEHQSEFLVPYGRGVGVTDDVTCNCCGSALSESNPVRLFDGEMACSACRE